MQKQKQYQVQLEKRWDKGKFWWELRACDYYSDFDNPKIVLPDIAMSCRFAYDIEKMFVANTGYIIPINDLFLLAILNSKLIEEYYRNISAVLDDPNKNGRMRFIYQYLARIPIRRISFTNAPDRRAALVEQAKALYSAEAPDSQKILDFVGARLSAAPEESDVVHDLLAYLAKRMIEMNKEKLKEGYDPTRREPKEKLQSEFNASVGKLAPLLGKIEDTDGLIDRIVYKLYGLTEDEIKIVDGSITGKVHETSA